MSESTLIRWLEEGRVLLGDGAMGTMLQAAGLSVGGAPEVWNLVEPQKVEAIHAGYVEASSNVITTNTFGGNRARLRSHGADERVYDANLAAAEIACAVAHPSGCLVAGSMGPTGELMEPMGLLSMAEAVSMFAEQARGLIEGGVDFVLIETMSQLSEVEAAVTGARSVDPGLTIAATMSFDTNYHTMMGVSPKQAMDALRGWGLRVLGANCGNGPGEIETVMAQMAEQRPEDVFLIAQSNAGLPQLVAGRTLFDGTPEVMADYAVKMEGLGINYIGACCGSAPAHIAAMHAALVRAKAGNKTHDGARRLS